MMKDKWVPVTIDESVLMIPGRKVAKMSVSRITENKV
jgi:hypothetical protein